MKFLRNARVCLEYLCTPEDSKFDKFEIENYLPEHEDSFLSSTFTFEELI